MVGCMNRSKATWTAIVLTVVLLLQLKLSALAGDATSDSIDLREAHLVVPDDLNRAEKKSIDLLVDEISARTRLRLPIDTVWPANAQIPVIAISTVKQLKRLPGGIANSLTADDRQPRAEGFRIRTETSNERAPVILVVGDDSRGVLFGVGKLLRSLEMSRDRIVLRTPLQVTTAPAMADSRTSAWLSTQNKFLRRLGLISMGAIYSRSGRLWLQLDRADSTPLGR